MSPTIFKSIFATLLLLVSLAGYGGADDKDQPCRLVWVASARGSHLPSTAVPIHGQRQYAVRGLNPTTGRYVLGTLDPKDDVAQFPFPNDETSRTATVLTNYELLTNPHECILKWPQLETGNAQPQFVVLVSENEGYSGYLGRALVPGGGPVEDNFGDAWVAGEIDADGSSGGGHGIAYAVDEDTYWSSTYQALVSYSEGLFLAVSELKYEDGVEGSGLDFVGIDQLHNMGDVEVIQRVSHSKHMEEVVSVSTTRETTSTVTKKSGWNIIIVGKERKEEHTYKERVDETWTTRTETEINLEVEVRVPAYTAVTVCSTVAIKDNINVEFTAKGVYSIPSFSPEEVQAILRADGVHGSTIIGDEVVIEMHGSMQATLAMNTQIIAVDSTDPEGCEGVARRVFRERVKMDNSTKKLQ